MKEDLLGNIIKSISKNTKILTITYPKNVAKVVDGLGYLPTRDQISERKDHNWQKRRDQHEESFGLYR